MIIGDAYVPTCTEYDSASASALPGEAAHAAATQRAMLLGRSLETRISSG